MQHEGRAVVFDSVEDMTKRIDDPALDVTESDVLVMRNAGPIGAPGMPEAGYLPIPKKLAQKGVKDMVRMSDARMSGTAFGTIVLHIAPESAVGGPLALVKTGDRIRLDVPARKLELLVDEAELKKRKDAWHAPAVPEEAARGYARLYREHVQQADQGCDFDFLAAVRNKLLRGHVLRTPAGAVRVGRRGLPSLAARSALVAVVEQATHIVDVEAPAAFVRSRNGIVDGRKIELPARRLMNS